MLSDIRIEKVWGSPVKLGGGIRPINKVTQNTFLGLRKFEWTEPD